jgi:periplasmic protein TonB
MTAQTKAFQWSFLIHTLIIATIVALGSFFKNPPKLLVINFDLETGQGSESPPAAKISSPRKTPPPPKGPTTPKIQPASKVTPLSKPLEKAAHPLSPEPQPQVSSLPSEQAAPVPVPSVKPQPPAENQGALTGTGLAGSTNALTGGGSGAGSAAGSLKGSGQGSGGPEGSGQNKYLREHFSYIRDKILRNIHYPSLARRMGWQGRVLLSFIVNLDGTIKEAKIVQGSGFDVLDKNAVDTVRDTAPFPKPPSEAKLVIPITYRLE